MYVGCAEYYNMYNAYLSVSLYIPCLHIFSYPSRSWIVLTWYGAVKFVLRQVIKTEFM